MCIGMNTNIVIVLFIFLVIIVNRPLVSNGKCYCLTVYLCILKLLVSFNVGGLLDYQ